MKVIVIGCTHAGTYAIQEILKDHPDTEVTVYEKNDNISFLSCGIALYLGGEVKDPAGLFYSSPDALAKLGAKVEMKHNVTDIDQANKTITVEDLDQSTTFTDTYDKLVITTGSLPIIPRISGIDNDKVMLCKNWNNAQELFKAAPDAKRITIVGAGYIGAELAEAYSKTGHEVTLIDSADRVLSKYYDKSFTDKIEQAYKDHGVHLQLEETVTGFEGSDSLTITTDKGSVETDLAILCIGFRPNTALLKDKVDMMPNGAIVTNEYMQTSDPDIFGAGDSVAVHFNPTGQNAYVPLATNAVRQGILVGKNLVKPTVKYMGTQSTSGLELYGMTMGSTGMTLDAALSQNMNAKQVLLTVNYRPDFMPTTEPVLMSLVYEPETHRILGGGLMSKYDITQSANTLSVCIQNQNTIDDLAMVDMLFQPNFDWPFNYLNLLAQAALDQEDEG
ncbi:FAD-dependent oxidoreductase [Levilactobacillus bambusae]|uniref:NADH oxidase n=1 Tax=Levilactobacillus bambusae TaxID=2024736 RepID=A0A2V1MY32_9LACO|nr:FAD-dependent oxidoreductase [Levilactobacillus bambusae]PWF99898.1 NADH oxidase [Levilactobacillus bambusae]